MWGERVQQKKQPRYKKPNYGEEFIIFTHVKLELNQSMQAEVVVTRTDNSTRRSPKEKGNEKDTHIKFFEPVRAYLRGFGGAA